jgi:hypothetical protein
MKVWLMSLEFDHHADYLAGTFAAASVLPFSVAVVVQAALSAVAPLNLTSAVAVVAAVEQQKACDWFRFVAAIVVGGPQTSHNALQGPRLVGEMAGFVDRNSMSNRGLREPQ